MVSRTRSRILLLAALFSVVVPAVASADGLFTPFGGVSFADTDTRKPTFGAALGFGGIVGIELDAARTELGKFSDVPVVDLSAHVTTVMANLMLRVPSGPIQPYASGGVGIVRLTGSVDIPFVGSLVSLSADDFGWNAGAGIMLFPSSRIGIRADLRRFETGDLSWQDITDISDVGDLPLPNVNFWRATGGLTFRF